MAFLRFGVGSGLLMGFLGAGLVLTSFNLVLLAAFIFTLAIRLTLVFLLYGRRHELKLDPGESYGSIAGFSVGFAVAFLGIMFEAGLVFFAIILTTPLILGYDFLKFRRAQPESDAMPREGSSLEYHKWYRRWMRNFFLAVIPSIAFLLVSTLVFPHEYFVWVFTLFIIIYLISASFMLRKFFRERKGLRA